MAMMALKAARAGSRKHEKGVLTPEQAAAAKTAGKVRGGAHRETQPEGIMPSAAKGSNTLGGKAVDRATSGIEERRRKLKAPSTLIGGGTK